MKDQIVSFRRMVVLDLRLRVSPLTFGPRIHATSAPYFGWSSSVLTSLDEALMIINSIGNHVAFPMLDSYVGPEWIPCKVKVTMPYDLTWSYVYVGSRLR